MWSLLIDIMPVVETVRVYDCADLVEVLNANINNVGIGFVLEIRPKTEQIAFVHQVDSNTWLEFLFKPNSDETCAIDALK